MEIKIWTKIIQKWKIVLDPSQTDMYDEHE